MKTRPADSISSFEKKLISLVLALTLWTGFAFIEHQLDLVEEHHSEHHCQLYACANHGVQSNLPDLPQITQALTLSEYPALYFVERALPNKIARSPPVG